MNKELDDMSKESYGLKSQIAHLENLIAQISDKQATLVNKTAAKPKEFEDNKDEDLKVIDVSPIKSLFCNMNLDNDGTGDKSTLAKRRPNDSQFLDLDAKIGKSGIEEVKTLDINESLKAMRISIDECKEITARMHAKKDCFVTTCSSSFDDNKDEI